MVMVNRRRFIEKWTQCNDWPIMETKNREIVKNLEEKVLGLVVHTLKGVKY